MFLYNTAVDKARSVKQGDMVSWNASGGRASGKVVRVVSSGTLSVPDSKFQLKGDKDNPAVLIQLYRDGKPTDKKVGHKLSSLTKSIDVIKHGSHDQKTHGRGGGGGGSGSAESSSPSSANELDKESKQAIQKIVDDARGIGESLGNNPQNDRVRDYAKGKVSALISEVDGASKGDVKNAKQKLSNARKRIPVIQEELENQNYHSEVKDLSALDIKLSQATVILGRKLQGKSIEGFWDSNS